MDSDQLLQSPRELAQLALQANQEHQYALAQYAGKLTEELVELDQLLTEADTEEGDSDLECDFYIPHAKSPAGPIRNFLNPQSPFFNDAMKRSRYMNFIVRHPMAPKEMEALKVGITTESKRFERPEEGPSTANDSKLTDKLNWAIIAEKVSDISSVKRTVEECKIKWIGELSASVNRGPWSASEVQNLHKILKTRTHKSKVNWVEVSQELGTHRLPIECMRKGCERPRHVWSAESDQKLLDATKLYGTAWSLVARYVSPETTPAQCASRYLRTLDPSLRRGAWSTEEDERLTAAVAGYGKSWAEVANVVPGRNSEQCRDRWIGVLDAEKSTEKKDAWTSEEDKTLVEAVTTRGNKWTAISILIGNKRTAVNCRLRYEKLKKRNFQPPSPVAGPSKLAGRGDEEDGSEPQSGRSAPRPRAKQNSQPKSATNPPASSEATRPRPRPLAKSKTAAPTTGTKRAAADHGHVPVKKIRQSHEQDTMAIDANAISPHLGQPQDATRHDLAEDSTVDSASQNPERGRAVDVTSNISVSSPKKSKTTISQTSDLPRRWSARLKAGGTT
ncbi:hypothetical protein B0H10DRAFT_32224 [Mycena sp. CBHHK59/15]|nr:hypothetical protein B0H10DRAFT_32224 [Mycena sp. CBHHK59/15]